MARKLKEDQKTASLILQLPTPEETNRIRDQNLTISESMYTCKTYDLECSLSQTGLLVGLYRRLDGLSLESCKDVAEYTRKFREIDFELKSLHSDAALPEPYLIYRYLTGLGDAYQIFVTIYIQTHNLYGDNKVSLTQVALAASIEEQLILSRQERSRVAMLARNNGNSSNSGRRRGRGKGPLSAISAGNTVTRGTTTPTHLPAQYVPAYTSKKTIRKAASANGRKWRASRKTQQGMQAKQGRR